MFDLLSDGASWMFSNIVEPFLVTPPISTDPGDPSFQIWSNIRVYGDIFLIIALLVIVFGESIGGGLIDAYTAKKILPRLLVAAVLINLSIYIVALMVDISNILGRGVGDILTAPLTHCSNGTGGNCWDFNLSLGDQARVFGVGIIGLLAGGTAAAGFLGALIFGGGAAVGAIITVAFFTLLPMFFAVLAVFITLIIRKGLILMLVLISPVAFALYCLPNTERFFRRWWDLLIEALMVYPIIVAIFGVAEILSITILTANGIGANDLQGIINGGVVVHNLNRTLSLVVAFLLQFLPLLAVPFAFRFASGALGRIYEAATGAGAKVNQLAENRREHAKRDYQAQALASRARIYHASRDFGDKTKMPGGRAIGRFIGRRAGGYNIEGLMSAARAEKKKMAEDQIANGRDEEIRGLMVNKQLSKKQKQAYWNKDLNGGDGGWAVSENGRALQDSELPEYGYGVKNGQTFYQSSGGAWISEGDVDAGQSRWGHDQFMQQAALGYEMRKAITDGQRTRLADQYYDVANGPGGWGMTKGEADGAWVGSSFENQATSLQYKYTKGVDPNTGKRIFDHAGYVGEVYEKRNSSTMSGMDAGSIDRLSESWDQLSTDNPQKRDELISIAKTMRYRMSQASVGDQEQGEEPGSSQVISYGSGHVTDSMQKFVDKVLGPGNSS